ncbi:IS701 family transposase [Streptomyces phaeochromogenes]
MTQHQNETAVSATVDDVGHDRAYFTREWAGDEERRELTGVPDELCFASKPQLAAHMLRAASQQGISASFSLGDGVYGGRELRTDCREMGLGYVVGVRSNHQVTTPAAKLSVTQAAARLPKRAWQRMRTGAGQKGVRDYDWAMIEVTADDTPDGHDRDAGNSVLLARRHRYTRTVSYHRCFAPRPVTLARLVSLVCLRWRVEDDFQDAKEICHLDKGQVTRWNSWHRWSVITLVAYAFLAVTAALERAAQTTRDEPDEADLLPLSSHELLRLTRLGPSATPTRPRPPAVVVHLAPPPSTPRPPLPPPLALVRRHHTMIRKLSSGYPQLP